MIEVKVKTEFLDRENNLKRRKEGEKFEVSKERAEFLSSLGYVEMTEKTKVKKTDKTE